MNSKIQLIMTFYTLDNSKVFEALSVVSVYLTSNEKHNDPIVITNI